MPRPQTPQAAATTCLLLSTALLATPARALSAAVSPWVSRVKPAADKHPARDWTKTPAVEPWWDEDVAAAPVAMQSAEFCEGLWGLPELPAPATTEPEGGDRHVRVGIYNIGGSVTKLLGASANKEFPLIPHVGVRIDGREHFYSDHVECRASAVMQVMMPQDTYPQVFFDLGVTDRDAESIEAWLKESEVRFCPDTYDLWKCNCNHFAQEFAEFLLPGTGFPQPLMAPVLDFTDSMLDNLPEWRRAMGDVFMNQLSRFVVVSWGRVLRKEKENAADDLGVERGA